MTPLAAPTDATVHLRLRGRLADEDLASVRQQLATCLSSGVTSIRVHADEQDDLDLQLLRALHGVAEHLHRRGGALTLLGARPRVLSRIAVHGLHALLPAGTDGRAARAAAPPSAPGGSTAAPGDS